MDKPSLRSVRVRITAVATVVVAVTITLAGFALVHVIENKLLGKIRTQGQAQLDAAEAQLDGGVPPDQLRSIIIGSPGFIQVFDTQGQPVTGVAGVAGP